MPGMFAFCIILTVQISVHYSLKRLINLDKLEEEARNREIEATMQKHEFKQIREEYIEALQDLHGKIIT